jgi:hypothetical protein
LNVAATGAGYVLIDDDFAAGLGGAKTGEKQNKHEYCDIPRILKISH